MIKNLSKPTVNDLQLRGLENTKEFISQCLDWKMNIGEYFRFVHPVNFTDIGGL